MFCDVEPKRKALAAANAELSAAQTKLSKIKAKIKVQMLVIHGTAEHCTLFGMFLKLGIQLSLILIFIYSIFFWCLVYTCIYIYIHVYAIFAWVWRVGRSPFSLSTMLLAIVMYVCQGNFTLLQLLDDNLAELTAQFEQATAAKLKCQKEAEATASTISLANRYTHVHYTIHQLLYATCHTHVG